MTNEELEAGRVGVKIFRVGKFWGVLSRFLLSFFFLAFLFVPPLPLFVSLPRLLDQMRVRPFLRWAVKPIFCLRCYFFLCVRARARVSVRVCLCALLACERVTSCWEG